jgi:hypothetical protein
VQRITVIDLAADEHDLLLSAACSLGLDEMRARLAEWAAVVDRSTAVRPVPGGVVLSLAALEPIQQLADLIDRESDCCRFYSFTLSVSGPAKELSVSAGAGKEAAVHALLGLPDGGPAG